MEGYCLMGIEFQDEKSAGDVLFNSVGLVNPTVHLKVLSWCILCYVFF